MGRRVKPVEGVYERTAGSGMWYGRYRVNGKLVRKAFGDDRAAAIAWVEKGRTLRRDGTGVVPTTAKQPARTRAEILQMGTTTLVTELCDDALRYSKRHHRDKLSPPSRIEAFRKKFGQRVADTLTAEEIESWLETLGKSDGTSNRYKSTVSLMYRLGIKAAKATHNPARDFPAKKCSEGVLRYLRPDEETRLRKAIRERFPHHMPELDLALYTGMRKGEMYALKWTEIDFENRIAMANTTKNGKPRTVYLLDEAVAALQTLKKAALGEYVFNISENRTWWAEALKDAKVVDFRWHDLRHTFCSRLCQRGVNLRVVQEAAGHRTIAMTTRYSHLDHTSMRQALSVLSGHSAQ